MGKFITFCRKKFRKENIQFSSHIFPFSDYAHHAQTSHFAEQNSWCPIWYKRVGLTELRKPEVVGSNPAGGHFFHTFLETRQNIL